MSNLPTVRQLAPSGANPNAPGVGMGDVFVDPAGVEAPAIVQGPAGAQTLQTLGGGTLANQSVTAVKLGPAAADGLAPTMVMVAAFPFGDPLNVAMGFTDPAMLLGAKRILSVEVIVSTAVVLPATAFLGDDAGGVDAYSTTVNVAATGRSNASLASVPQLPAGRSFVWKRTDNACVGVVLITMARA